MSFLAAAHVHADKLNADLKVCVQSSDGEPVAAAAVTLIGGKIPVKLTAGNDHCYHNKNIAFDTTKDYSIEVTGQGYERTTKPVSIVGINPNSEIALAPIVLVSQSSPTNSTTSSPATPSPLSSPTPAAGEAIQNGNLTSTVFYIVTTLIFFVILGLGVFVLWRMSNRVNDLASNVSQIDKSIGLMAVACADIKSAVEGVAIPPDLLNQQQRKADLLHGMYEELKRIAPAHTEDAKTDTGAALAVAPSAAQLSTSAPALSDKEKSIVAYQCYLKGETVFPEPLHLSDIGGSSAEDLLGGRTVILHEHLQGAILLFRSHESDNRGWIYPDTAYYYNEAELKSVFRTISQNQFDCLKVQKSLDGCRFEPVSIRQVPDTQTWQVEV